ncbi:hypothetical protein ABZ543_24770 [Streptomyces roseifaciens]
MDTPDDGSGPRTTSPPRPSGSPAHRHAALDRRPRQYEGVHPALGRTAGTVIRVGLGPRGTTGRVVRHALVRLLRGERLSARRHVNR